MAVAGAALLPDSLFAATDSKLKRVGVQLYSVRDAMKADPQGTLKKIADAGYAHVEHANYIDRKFYGYTAKEFKKILADLVETGRDVALVRRDAADCRDARIGVLLRDHRTFDIADTAPKDEAELYRAAGE